MTDSPFRKWDKLPILIIGDVMIDRYVNGYVDRISPEAPVPILSHQNTINRLGGASNVALNINALGAVPLLIGVVGKDRDSELFHTLLNEENINSNGIITDAKRPTTVKTRILSGTRQMLRIDRESTVNINSHIRNQLVDRIISFIKNKSVAAIIIQDYNKGVLTPESIPIIMNLADEKRIPVIVDPKFNNFYNYKRAALFKPNMKETAEKIPFEVTAAKEPLLKADHYIRSKLQNRITMITLSENGIYLNDGKNDLISPVRKKEIVDVCGAGDTVLSIASLCIATNLGIREIGLLSNLAGGQVCGKFGVVPVDRDELEKDYLEYIMNIGL